VAKKEKNEKLKSSKEGALTIWQAEEKNNTLYATVASKGTLLMALDKDSLLKAASGEKTGKLGAELKSAMGKVKGSESLWVAGVVNEEMKNGLANNPQTKKYADKLKSMFGSLTLTDAIQLGIRVQTTETKTAEEISKMLNDLKPLALVFTQGNEKMAPIVKELVDNLKIGTEQTEITIDLKVAEELLKKIQAATNQQ
jgi:hypothetical protein